ncbi:MAG: cysteine desulfurase [Gammaproteobacteria bacterium]|nr:cysteine desulfurase [Gammaproteobacteria bacterium]
MVAYLDYNASTPLDARVLDAMLPFMQEHFGNPSSAHSYGRTSRQAIEQAREQVAALVQAHPSQVIFTSGGTEANNMAIKGVAARTTPGRVAVSGVEHASVLAPAQALSSQGWQVDYLGVDEQGRIESESLRENVNEDTRLVSVMMANNESGIIQDLPAIAEQVRPFGSVLHTDAVQLAGKLALDFAATGAQLMSLSAHKLYGPKGVGALVIDKTVDMEPLLHGGKHEKGYRSGTENLAGIVGFGMAAELAANELESRQQHLLPLRQYLEQQLKQRLPEVMIFGEQAERLPNTVFFAQAGIDGASLLMNMDQQGFAIASGSACGSDSSEPSHVLKAMGVPTELAHSAIRVSLGRDNSQGEIDAFIKALGEQVGMLKSMATTAWV